MKMHDLWDSKFAQALTDSGFNIGAAIAGFLGGLIAAYIEPRDKKWWHKAANWVAGGITAGFATDLILHIANLPAKLIGGVAFTVGLFGMAVVNKIISFILVNDLGKILDTLIPVRRFLNNRKKDKK
jgi:hypothetical protein